MVEEKETADIQIRISKKTLEAIEAEGEYSDKNPEGILSRVLPEYKKLKETCPITTKSEKEPLESEIKGQPEKEEVTEPEEKPEEQTEKKTSE